MFQPNSTRHPLETWCASHSTTPPRLDRMGGGQLPLPGGIAQGLDGAMYVSVNSASPVPGSGAIVKIQMR